MAAASGTGGMGAVEAARDAVRALAAGGHEGTRAGEVGLLGEDVGVDVVAVSALVAVRALALDVGVAHESAGVAAA